MICGSGGSKSKLAKAAGAEPAGQMRDEKLHAVVARSTFRSQNVQNTPLSDHFWTLKCRCGAKHISKSKCTKHLSLGPLLEVEMSKKCTRLWREEHFKVKMLKTPGFRTTFGGSDVEKLHAVVARSTFQSQNVKNTRVSDHFWRFRCRFASLHYITLHSTTLHCTKLHYITQHYNYKYTTTLHYTPLHSTTLHYTPLHYTTLHYTTLHSTTLHYTKLHYTTLHYTTLHYNYNYTTTLHYITLHYTPLHYITLHYITLHYTTFHYTSLHYTTLHSTTVELQLRIHNYTPLHSTTLNYTTLHYTTLHDIPLHSTTLHYITLHYITLNDTAPQIDRSTGKQIDR